jgi:hypothetical protein
MNSRALARAQHALVNPAFLKVLLAVGQPVRLLVAFNIWMGRSLRRLAAALGRSLLILAGWLYGRISQRRWVLYFERRYFTPRRWHVLLGEAPPRRPQPAN